MLKGKKEKKKKRKPHAYTNCDHLWKINFERKDDSFFSKIMEFVRFLSILKGKIDHNGNILKYVKCKYIDIIRSKLKKKLFCK